MEVSVSAASVISTHDEVTGPAINGAALARVKGNCRGGLAPGAICTYLDSMPLAGGTGKFDRLEPDILRLLTLLAAFRRVFKVLVTEKGLFPCSPDKIVLTVDTGDRHVREFAAGFSSLTYCLYGGSKFLF